MPAQFVAALLRRLNFAIIIHILKNSNSYSKKREHFGPRMYTAELWLDKMVIIFRVKLQKRSPLPNPRKNILCRICLPNSV